MGKRETYEPGTFCWPELATSDADASKSFYASLFGWEFEDREAGEGFTYSMASVDGSQVGALYPTDQGAPRWNSYIAVESADDAAKKAGEAGADIVVEPMDVMDSGRMAVLQDPSGAVVSVWEPKEHIGAQLVNAPGALCWNDLMTHDVDKAVEFYAEVFDWEIGSVEDAPDDRHGIKIGEQMNGGMARIPEAAGTEVMPHWLACFAVEDVEQALETIDGEGGAKLSPVIDVPSGRFAVVADPQGAVFAVVDGDMDD
jgi:predicted enzyme related to lactoylglutathione lyase